MVAEAKNSLFPWKVPSAHKARARKEERVQIDQKTGGTYVDTQSTKMVGAELSELKISQLRISEG